MSFTTTLNFLLHNNNFGDDASILKKMIIDLNLTQLSYPIILVGGTNGKGSVCAYLSTILTNAGYNVGMFTSPHVLEYNERIKINNTAIDSLTLDEALQEVLAIAAHYNYSIGLFKAFALASHLIFLGQCIDIAVIEVGIGGANDVTNLFEPFISAITNIDFDHKEILGDTLDKIGEQKAGIFRRGKYAFWGSSQIPPSVVNVANATGTYLQILGRDFILEEQKFSFNVRCANASYFSLPYPALRGIKQATNAALAIAILDQLHSNFPVGISHIKYGLLQTTLIGRFQLLPGYPQVILDVAHNPHAVTHMLENMLKLPTVKNSYAVFGIAADKDINSIILKCRDVFNKWFIAKIAGPRGLDTQSIAEALFHNGIKDYEIFDNISLAYLKVKSLVQPEDRIVCFGSFLVVEAVYKTINRDDN